MSFERQPDALMNYVSSREGADWKVSVEVHEDPRRRMLTRTIHTSRTVGSETRQTMETHRLRVFDRNEILDALESAGLEARQHAHTARRSYRRADSDSSRTINGASNDAVQLVNSAHALEFALVDLLRRRGVPQQVWVAFVVFDCPWFGDRDLVTYNSVEHCK